MNRQCRTQSDAFLSDERKAPMTTRLRRSQLNLLGQLEAAHIRIDLHVENGIVQRTWWIGATDDNEDQVLLWSDTTPPGPHGGLNLAELMSALLDIFRLIRNARE